MTPLDDDDNEIMCLCSGTTRGKIKQMVNENLDLDSISRRTGALSGCAGCEWDIEQLFKALTAHQKL